jgi:hypothetical protein
MALLAFDFTQDVTILEDAGVSVNLDRLVDCQLSTVTPHEELGFLGATRVPGLAGIIAGLHPTIDPLVVRAQKKVDKSTNWDALEYLREKGEIINLVERDEFLRYAAADISMTGLACTVLVNKGLVNDTVQKTRQKGENSERGRKSWGIRLVHFL